MSYHERENGSKRAENGTTLDKKKI
jgi:hypothetical protein